MLLTLDKNKSTIIQHNKILLGGQSINLRARQLVYVLARLMKEENPLDEIRINSKEFLEFINESHSSDPLEKKEKWSDIYALTNDIFKHLNDNPILVKKERGKDFKKINWLSSLGVERSEIIGRFSADIAYYFAYKKNEPYTKLLWDLRYYKSAHTARIVDLFQKFHRKESGDIEVKFNYDAEELKFFLGVKDRYAKFSDFTRRVLEPTRKELESNDIIPYWFEYKIVRQGKTVKEIAFTVFVRHELLLALIPELKFLGTHNNSSPTIFDSAAEKVLSELQMKIVSDLVTYGLNKGYALKVLSHFTDTQSIAYLYLIKYGVNKALAFSLVMEHCSFGELTGYEHHYVKHTLEQIEEARIKRLAKETGTKRTTPDDKKGGLAKKIFLERQYFSSFMEILPRIKTKENPLPNEGSQSSHGVRSIGDILKSTQKR